VPQPARDGLLGCRARRSGLRQEAAEPSEVFFVLVFQDGDQPLRRDDAEQLLLAVDDRHRPCAAMGRFPCDRLLIRVGPHRCGIWVDQAAERSLGIGRE
jgi:hypothetical protein